MKVEGQSLFNLLLDEEFRQETLDGMKKNIIRDAAGVAVSHSGIDAALDTANLKSDLDYFKNAKKATTMVWTELFKGHQVKTSNAEAMEMPDLFGYIKKLFKK